MKICEVMNENLKYIEAGLRACEVRMSPRKIWLVIQIAAQISANEEVGIKEVIELKHEADRLFDSAGNLKLETGNELDVVGPPEQRKTGFDFGSTRYVLGYGQRFFTPNRVLSQEWFCDSDEWQIHECIDHREWLYKGEVFNTEEDCRQYVNYLNSLQP